MVNSLERGYKNKTEFYKAVRNILTQPNVKITTCYDLERVGRFIESRN